MGKMLVYHGSFTEVQQPQIDARKIQISDTSYQFLLRAGAFLSDIL